MTAGLLALSRAMIGRVPGSLSQVAIVASMFFGGVMGSASAEAAAIGSVLIPAMEKEGYPKPYAAAFDRPDERAVPEWEPLSLTRTRVLAAVGALTVEHPGDLVLVGHGTAWTVLVAALTGHPPDLAAWERLAMPDVWVVGDAPE